MLNFRCYYVKLIIWFKSKCVFFQEGWCDSKRTLKDVKAKLKLRHEGALNRDRAKAYSLAQKVLKYLCSLTYNILNGIYIRLYIKLAS